MILLILFPILFVGDTGADYCLPSRINIYYMTDDPWGWIGDSAYLPEDLKTDYPNCLTINSVADIKLLAFPTIDTASICKFLDFDRNHYIADARFIVELQWPTHAITIILGTSPFDISIYDNTPFINKEYYNIVSKYVAKRDRKFKKWYRLHYHKGKWHFFYWQNDKRISRE